MNSIKTFNEFHLGDNLIHLNYLYRLSRLYPDLTIEHYLNINYIHELRNLIPNSSNISLFDIESKPSCSVNSWIGFDGYYYNSPLQGNWVDFHLDFFKNFSVILGVKNPIINDVDLLFDFPILENFNFSKKYDFLIVNSKPLSSQISDFDEDFLNNLIKELIFKGYTVAATHPNGIVESTIEKGYGLLQVGQISNNCQAIIGVPNGPMWLTFNKFNQNQVMLRLAWLSRQQLYLGSNCHTCVSGEHISAVLKHLGIF